MKSRKSFNPKRLTFQFYSNLRSNLNRACLHLQANINDREVKKKSITPINMALSSTEGSAEMNIVHPGAGANSLSPIERASNGKTESVTLKKLDTFAREQGLTSITMLKIDAEGHDGEVLRGAKNLIAESRIDVIQFEYNWRWIYEGFLLRNVFCQLTEKGYRIGKVTPKGIQFYPRYNAALETFEEANFIASKPEWVTRFPIVPVWYLKRGEGIGAPATSL